MNNTTYAEHKAIEALDRFDERHKTQAQRDANPNYEDERSALVDALALADGTAERTISSEEKLRGGRLRVWFVRLAPTSRA